MSNKCSKSQATCVKLFFRSSNLVQPLLIDKTMKKIKNIGMWKGSLLNCTRLLFVALLILVALLISPTRTLTIRTVNNLNNNDGLSKHSIDKDNNNQVGIDLASNRGTLHQRMALESPNPVNASTSSNNTLYATNSVERATSTSQSAGALAALIVATTVMIGLTLVIIIFIAIFMIYARRKEVLNRKASLHNDIVNTNKVVIEISQGL